MSLLPSRFAINDQLTPLGKLVEKVEPVKVDPIEAFNKGDHNQVDDPTMPFFGFDLITEADCRQSKGVAQRELARAEMPQTPVATPPKSRVDAFCEKHAPPKREPVMWKSVNSGLFVRIANGVPQRSYAPQKDEWEDIGMGPMDALSKLSNPKRWTPIYASDAPPKEGEWKDCGDDMPDIPAGQYELRRRDGAGGFYPPMASGGCSLRVNVDNEFNRAAHQYRVIA